MCVFKASDRFVQSEDGAVSVDWVLLSAFCIGIGLAVTFSLGTSVSDYGVEIDTTMTERSIPTYGTGDGGAGL